VPLLKLPPAQTVRCFT